MKLKHWFILGLVAVGGLYVLHITVHHGGFSGFASGLGIPGMKG